jgi:hypothetical protein
MSEPTAMLALIVLGVSIIALVFLIAALSSPISADNRDKTSEQVGKE